MASATHTRPPRKGCPGAAADFRRPRAVTRALALIALALCGPLARPTLAQSSPAAQPTIIDPAEIDGSSFHGLLVPTPPIAGDIELQAIRCHTWTSDDPIGRGTVHRVLLSQDVVLALSGFTFECERACLWLQDTDGQGTYQVFAYLDRVRTPRARQQLDIAADRLPVEGVLRTTSRPTLRASVSTAGPPLSTEDDGRALAFVRESERALASYLRGLLAPAQAEFADDQLPPGLDNTGLPMRPTYRHPDDIPAQELARRVAPIDADAPILPPDALLTVQTGSVELRGGDDGRVLIISDGFFVQHRDAATGRTVDVGADRAVLFLTPGSLSELAGLAARSAPNAPGSGEIPARELVGIYLEGDVIADSVDARGRRSRFRSPRVYYDVRNDRSLLIDAVYQTSDDERGMPIYIRADTIRRESTETFRASDVTLTNTPFRKPHLSLGASEVTITRKSSSRGESASRTVADARNLTLNAGPIPFLYLPKYVGDPSQFPLRDLALENSSGSGTSIKTAWDLPSLLGLDTPDGFSADLLLDGYFQRGLAVGLDLDWRSDDARGSLLGYTLFNDTGKDQLASGARVERDGDTRSALIAEHRHRLNEHWRLTLEAAHLSDPTVADALFDSWTRTRRELATGATVERIDERSRLALQARGSLNDFAISQHILQSSGYTVGRLPEIIYERVGDDVSLFAQAGLLTYHGSARAGVLNMTFTEASARELGYGTNPAAQRALGTDADQSPGDVLRARGLTEQPVARIDTRHELTAQLGDGVFNLQPFVVGRATAYDDPFPTFSPENDDRLRLWGAVGARAATSFSRTNHEASSKLLDISRLRHIVEPHATVMVAGTTIEQEHLPVYDEAVESLAEGSVVNFGVKQTLQTQRGGPGRWRSVDLLTADATLTFASDDGPRESRIGRYFDFRPELARLGDFGSLSAAWQATNSTRLVASTIYDMEINQQAATSVGIIFDQGGTFKALAEARFLNPENDTIINADVSYQLTAKYALSAGMTYNTDRSDFQRVSAELRRKFPSVELGAGVAVNNITDETGLFFSIIPVGLGNRGARLRGLGSADPNERGGGIGG